MSKYLKYKGIWITASALLVGLVVWFITHRGGSTMLETPMFTVQKGTLQINVLQGGEIRALKNYEVKSEIELPTKILSLINEGFRITDKDIKEGKVLVELDSADIKDKINTQEIEFQNAIAAYIDADEQRAIQQSDNLSLLKEAEQTMRFALMDFERYVGKKAAQGILKERHVPYNLQSLDEHQDKLQAAFNALQESSGLSAPKEDAEDVKSAGKGDDLQAAVLETILDKAETSEKAGKPDMSLLNESDKMEQPHVDFLAFLKRNEIGDGEAQQKLRSLENDCLIHRSELGLAKQNLEASQKLAQKSFITKTTLETDTVNYDKIKLTVDASDTALDLFNKYEFPKQAELYLSAYEEALNKLQRTIRANRARMAQAESKYVTAKSRHEITLSRKNDLERQKKACVIRAVEPGLVAYGAHDQNSSYRSSDAIEEGAAVRFRQTILNIPNMEQMGVKVSVHESQIKKVRIGQQCRITVDAEPGKTLEGSVAEMAVLPDSSSSRYTPNLKVYITLVAIKGTHEWLKPGMNAKVEIIVNQLDDILYVPVQSIEVENDRYFTYISNGTKLERREIVTGSFNDEFIEVKSGIKVGDQVALAIPKRTFLDGSEALPSAPKPKEKGVSAPRKGLVENEPAGETAKVLSLK